MSNLIDWIKEECNENDIEGVVIGQMGWGEYNKEIVPGFEKIPFGKLISYETAKPLLNYEFDSGYGAPECNAIYVWTKDKVLFISQYDGATSMESVPRNPIDCMPTMPGG